MRETWRTSHEVFELKGVVKGLRKGSRLLRLTWESQQEKKAKAQETLPGA